MKQVVMPLAETPQKHDCQPPPEQVITDSRVSKAYSSSSLVRKDWNGATGTRHNSGEALASYVYACRDEGATRMQQLLNVKAQLGTQHTHFIVMQADRKPLDKTLHS